MGPSTHRGARKSGHSRRAMQGKGVFSLRELAKYFCLVEIAEDFRGKKTQILLFKRHFCFHCEIFVNSEHHRRKGKSAMILQNGKNRSKSFLGTLMLLLFIRACTHAHPYTHFNGWCAPFLVSWPPISTSLHAVTAASFQTHSPHVQAFMNACMCLCFHM